MNLFHLFKKNMKKKLVPIDTLYAGHYFRSRLEAKWAVYFDAIGVKWTYEPEGYVLPSGAKYLPDFYFPDYKVYGEIKPQNFVEDKRHFEFVKETETPFLLFIDNPGVRPNYIFLPNFEDVLVLDGYAFADRIWDKKYGLFFYGSESLAETAQQMPEYTYGVFQSNTIRFDNKLIKNRILPYHQETNHFKF